MKKLLCLGLSALMLAAAVGCGTGSQGSGSQNGGGTAEELQMNDLSSGFLRTAATDDYGRTFSASEGYNDRYVGIFYFLWLSQADVDNTVQKYIDAGRGEETLTSQVGFGNPKFTWWGEPMYGYYQVEDEWVVRKHVELFINAGLDFICFDTTNNDHYSAAARTVLNVLLEYQKLGYRVPKAMFMTNSDSPGRIKSIYNDFYRRDTYDSIWFTGGGEKPWIIGQSPATDDTIMDRFYFKHSQWPNASIKEDGFPWISWKWPQEEYYDFDHDLKIMSVSVTQHVGDASGRDFSLSGICSPSVRGTLSSDTLARLGGEERLDYYYNSNWGRGYSHKTGRNDETLALSNINFEEQWENVYENGNINLVFVTGWNEWIAQRQPDDPVLGDRYGHYIDTFNTEFSRDIEMMAGGYLDNCFLQLVKNIRAYKTLGEPVASFADTALDLTRPESWQSMPAYADLVRETEPRAHMGAGGSFYTNTTGRNDIREVRVATTEKDICFLITTENDITAREEGDTRFMNLWLGVEGQTGGFNGLQYVINRTVDGTTASVDKIQGSSFTRIGDAQVTVRGRYMFVTVPKSLVGASGGFTLQFKVTDNLQKDLDITDLYTNGDCAPIGRINYSYTAR